MSQRGAAKLVWPLIRWLCDFRMEPSQRACQIAATFTNKDDDITKGAVFVFLDSIISPGNQDGVFQFAAAVAQTSTSGMVIDGQEEDVAFLNQPVNIPWGDISWNGNNGQPVPTGFRKFGRFRDRFVAAGSKQYTLTVFLLERVAIDQKERAPDVSIRKKLSHSLRNRSSDTAQSDDLDRTAGQAAAACLNLVSFLSIHSSVMGSTI